MHLSSLRTVFSWCSDVAVQRPTTAADAVSLPPESSLLVKWGVCRSSKGLLRFVLRVECPYDQAWSRCESGDAVDCLALARPVRGAGLGCDESSGPWSFVSFASITSTISSNVSLIVLASHASHHFILQAPAPQCAVSRMSPGADPRVGGGNCVHAVQSATEGKGGAISLQGDGR